MPDEGPLSHFPCGSVDWNSFLLCFETILLVTSLAEVWIETCSQYCLNERLWSLPLRKCGLKQSVCRVIYKTVYVTSLAEVWIETGAWSDCCHCSTVTSLAEVWIETCRNRLLTGACAVTSLAEVWIETRYILTNVWFVQSLPLRKCGLKQENSKEKMMNKASLPLRKCGLKHTTGATLLAQFLSLPLRKCGLKQLKDSHIRSDSGHFPCGSVDWNLCLSQYLTPASTSLPLRKCGLKPVAVRLKAYCPPSLPLRKCGLKRSFDSKPYGNGVVTSLAEVWIETVIPSLRRRLRSSLPLRKCGLKQFCRSAEKQRLGHFPCGSVDWNCKRW